ncbi:MAG: hypothetical protein MJ238_02690 [Bacilli bacterium]|nr:hypothetical protein [Bacilli bacterium]
MENKDVELVEETPEEIKSNKKSMIGWIVFFSVMVVLMVGCIVVIKVLGD